MSSIRNKPHPNGYLSNDQLDLLAVLDQANHIASMTSLEELLEQMLELMIDVSGGETGTLYLLDKRAGELVFKVVGGIRSAQNLVGMRIKEDQGIVGASIKQRTPIVIDELSSDPRWYRDIDPEKTAVLHNAITLPLLLQGEPIGAVQIFNFVHSELELLKLLGNRMASEVDKVMLLEKAQRSNQRMQALVDALGNVGATLDREQLLHLLTDNASQLLDAERSSVILSNRNTEEIVVVSSGEEYQSINNIQLHSFQAHSIIAAPLRARPIILGKERSMHEERVIGNLMVLNKQQGNFDDEDTQLLGILASQASTVLQISDLYTGANELFLDFIKVMASTIDAKDPYTRGHSQRVADLSVMIAQQLELGIDMVHDIRIGSLLHDIGKIGIPDSIIAKPERLSTDEYEQMKKHPAIGFRIMNQVHLLNNVLPAISEHHERLDGSGYPFGLHGDQISLMGRIVCVADVFDAMTTDRPYRKGLDALSVFNHLQENISTLYDGDTVEALINSYTPT